MPTDTCNTKYLSMIEACPKDSIASVSCEIAFKLYNFYYETEDILKYFPCFDIVRWSGEYFDIDLYSCKKNVHFRKRCERLGIPSFGSGSTERTFDVSILDVIR